jgi:hypothetical protein
MAWTTAVVGFVVAVPLWRFTKYTITVAHEGGHAMFGMLTGQQVKGIKIDRYGGGVTNFPPKMPWPADVIITMAGYLGPSAVGLAGVYLLRHDRPQVLLWASLGLLAVLVLKMRNPLGFAAVIGTGLVLFWAARQWSGQAQLTFAYVWTWFLLMGSTRTIPDLLFATRVQDRGSDAAVMEKLTILPDVFWLVVFWGASMAALIFGGAALLHHG